MLSPLAKPSAPEQAVEQPVLVFFTRESSGPCRIVEAFLAQVLQRRRNHETFRLRTVDVDRHPELATRFRVTAVPTLVVVDQRRLAARLVAPRHVAEIRQLLAPWLS